VIDEEGFRANVGIIVTDGETQVLWAKRVRQNAWQFPQGGILPNENPEAALYRELYEELGLSEADVEILGCTRSWLRYRLPEHLLRHHLQPLCIGQKQKWYMLRLISSESHVHLNISQSPEFDNWRWVHYWYPLKQVIPFKRHVYRRALEELAPLVPRVLKKTYKKQKQPRKKEQTEATTPEIQT
jgi:putative (di)nucleoside polyphosphate hydrolase